jgi:hypothetical protein
VSHRRWGACGAGLEVGEDGRDHPRVGDDGKHSQCCTAARATGDVDVAYRDVGQGREQDAEASNTRRRR